MVPAEIRRIDRSRNPFGQDGLGKDANGVLHFEHLTESLTAMLQAYVQATPRAEAIVELGGERLTYSDLWDRAARVSGGLRDAGISRGDRVAIRYAAGVDWVVTFFGTIMAGGIAVLPNTRSAPPEIAFMLADTGASIDLGPGTPLPDGAPYVNGDIGRSDTAAMFFTSGTTGKSKAVPTTHEAFLTSAENMLRAALRVSSESQAELRTLISVPLFHVTGCCAQLITVLSAGGSAVIMPTLDQAALIGALGRERINFLVTVPAVYALILRRPEFADADVSGVRWVGYGGAAITPALVAAIKRAFPRAEAFNGYGMSETASIMTVLPDADAADHADSVGYAVPSVELAIRPSGEDPNLGELLARGANVMTGYWNRPEATAEARRDDWLHTGDIVRVDEAGRIHIVDRSKDIIIRGGENISSLEVEGELAAAPTVLEAAVLAVPDDVMGEKVGAVLYGGEDEVDVDAVLTHCRERLAGFKVPQYVRVVTQPLPRNAGGKVLKGALRDTVVWGEPLR